MRPCQGRNRLGHGSGGVAPGYFIEPFQGSRTVVRRALKERGGRGENSPHPPRFSRHYFDDPPWPSESVPCRMAAAPSIPPRPMDSTAVLGTSISAPFSFKP